MYGGLPDTWIGGCGRQLHYITRWHAIFVPLPASPQEAKLKLRNRFAAYCLKKNSGNSIFTTAAKVAFAGIKSQEYINPADRSGALDFLPGYALSVAYMMKMEWHVRQD